MRALERLFEDLERQRTFVATRAPVYGRILELLPQVLPLDRLEETWRDRAFEAWFDRPLLLLAALRDDALHEGTGHPLDRAIGSSADVEAATPAALRTAFAPERPVWRKLRDRFVQTNETSRAVTWLWPAHLLGAARPGASIQIFDIGASAGLNLVGDALPRIWTRADGEPLALDPLPAITVRRGFDRRPIDAGDEESARWLRACTWPGQTARQERLDQAIGAWRRADPSPELVTSAAGDVPPRLPRDTGDVLIAFQSVMRDYLAAEERARYESGMRQWLDDLPPGQAFWIEMEVTPGAPSGGPAGEILLHARDCDFLLAECDAHPSTLTVFEPAVAALAAYLS